MLACLGMGDQISINSLTPGQYKIGWKLREKAGERCRFQHAHTFGKWIAHYIFHTIMTQTSTALSLRLAKPELPHAKRRVSPAIIVSILLCLGLPAGLHGQISPGALARPHQFLNGPTQCMACHRLAMGSESLKCLECHTEIASRLAAHEGFHASVCNVQ